MTNKYDAKEPECFSKVGRGAQKTKLYIYTSECYPMYSLLTDGLVVEIDYIELTDGELANYREISNMFWAWQERIGEMSDKNWSKKDEE